MRQGDPMADTGGAERLALQDLARDQFARELRRRLSSALEVAQQRVLVLRRDLDRDREVNAGGVEVIERG